MDVSGDESRMRATAPLRSSLNSPRKVNHLQAQGGEARSRPITDAGYAGTPPIGRTSALNLLLSVLMID